jgi:NAD-dependent deacetylase sirtuin 5
VRNKIAPGSTFTLITQNVDGLSTRALDAVLSQASDEDKQPPHHLHPHMTEMHGRLFDVKCSSETCRYVEHNLDSPICEALRGTESLVEKGVMDPDIPRSALPRCSKCGALARPGVVWFGESIPGLRKIDKLVAKADLCLVVGTSSTVRFVSQSIRLALT